MHRAKALMINEKHSSPTSEFELEYWKKNLLIAGVDEAGRGPLAGPVLAAAVILPINCSLPPNINDSKLLSEKKREELFKHIKANAVSIGIGIVENEEIDQINILNATYKAMNLAIADLGILPEIAFIDGNSFKSDGIKYKTIIKGDKRSISIAAASIIAKVKRDEIMTKQIHLECPNYFFDENKGYGTKKHYEAIKKYGICKYHRKTFLKNLHQENPSEFNLF